MMSRSFVGGAGPLATVFSGRMAQPHTLACSPAWKEEWYTMGGGIAVMVEPIRPIDQL